MRPYSQAILLHSNEPLVFPLNLFLFLPTWLRKYPRIKNCDLHTADLILISHKITLKSGLQSVCTFSLKDRYDDSGKHFSQFQIEEIRRTAKEFIELNS